MAMIKSDKHTQKDTLKAIEALLPKANEYDNPFVNIRRIWALREALGFSCLKADQLQTIAHEGYDAYFIKSMNNCQNLGLDDFYELTSAGKVHLTMEYIMFHYFYENLKHETRQKIANLLVEVYDKELSFSERTDFSSRLFA
jgi:hypothetical protein